MAWLRHKREDPKIELTPMVDVVFLLLIFFMISTTFIETPGISVNLPESSSRVVEKTEKEVKVYLDKEGNIFLGDQPLTWQEFRSRMNAYRPTAANSTFVLLADRESLHGRVVQIMDLGREVGFSKLAIATEPLRPNP